MPPKWFRKKTRSCRKISREEYVGEQMAWRERSRRMGEQHLTPHLSWWQLPSSTTSPVKRELGNLTRVGSGPGRRSVISAAQVNKSVWWSGACRHDDKYPRCWLQTAVRYLCRLGRLAQMKMFIFRSYNKMEKDSRRFDVKSMSAKRPKLLIDCFANKIRPVRVVQARSC